MHLRRLLRNCITTHLVKRPTDINWTVLNHVVHNLRQRGGEIWVRELKQNSKLFPKTMAKIKESEFIF